MQETAATSCHSADAGLRSIGSISLGSSNRTQSGPKKWRPTCLMGARRAPATLGGARKPFGRSDAAQRRERGGSSLGHLCGRAGIAGLPFHDLRHEAVSRLFENVLYIVEVATISGHKELRMLSRYGASPGDGSRQPIGVMRSRDLGAWLRARDPHINGSSRCLQLRTPGHR